MLRGLLVLLLLASPAIAHDKERPELNKWFDSLASEQGPCCSTSDATTVADADWRSKGGHYEVLVEGNWLDVDPSAVINTPNLDGHTMVWFHYLDGVLLVRCFMPGSMT